MKKLFSLFAVSFLFSAAQAQDIPFIDFGFKAGPSMSFYNTAAISGTNLNKDGGRLGFTAGAFARVKVPFVGFYVQPELLISNFGGKISQSATLPIVGTFETKSTLNLTTIDVPVLIGNRFGIGPLGLRFGAGPAFSFLMSAKERIDINGNKETEDVKEDLKSSFVSLQVGLGLDISKINIDLRYQHGLSNIAKDSDTKSKVSAIIATIGFKIF